MKQHAIKKYLLSFLLLGSMSIFLSGASPEKVIPISATVPEVAAPASVPDLSAEAAAATAPASTSFIDNSTALTYYSQSDPQWSAYLYGGNDPLSAYGCGPTVLAMLISSLTENPLTPPEAADWAAANGYWAHQSGSVHALIPDGAKNFGLAAESMNILTEKSIRLALSYHKYLVFLMGPGDFTSSGHFIIAYGINEDGTIQVADPASAERSAQAWPIDVLLSQVSSATDAGGPVWAFSSLSASN